MASQKAMMTFAHLLLVRSFSGLAAKYCFNLDSPSFPDIFEPLHLATCIGFPGGSERALQTVQVAMEHGVTDAQGHTAPHIDGINAGLQCVYADTKLANH